MGYEVDDLQKAQAAKPGTWAAKGAVLALLVALFLGYAGNFHFVHGANITLRKVNKVSWSLSETLINADEVKATPVFLLRAKYPLFTQAAEAL